MQYKNKETTSRKTMSLKWHTKVTHNSPRWSLNDNVLKSGPDVNWKCLSLNRLSGNEFWTWHFGLGLLLLDGQRSSEQKMRKVRNFDFNVQSAYSSKRRSYSRNATSNVLLQRNRTTEIGENEFHAATTEVYWRHCLFVQVRRAKQLTSSVHQEAGEVPSWLRQT